MVRCGWLPDGKRWAVSSSHTPFMWATPTFNSVWVQLLNRSQQCLKLVMIPLAAFVGEGDPPTSKSQCSVLLEETSSHWINVSTTIDTRTQWIGNNTFYGYVWWDLQGPGAFSMGTTHFGQIRFMFSQSQKFISLSWYSLSTLEGMDVSLQQKVGLDLFFTKPGKPPQKCLSRSESYACLRNIFVHSVVKLFNTCRASYVSRLVQQNLYTGFKPQTSRSFL